MGNVTQLRDGRPPAQLVSLDAEREILGCVLAAPTPSRAREILALVRSHEWASDKHRDIARAMSVVAERGYGVEFVAVLEQMREDGTAKRWGDGRALSECLDRAGTVDNAEAYAATVRGKAKDRALAALGQRLQLAALDGEGDSDAMRQALHDAHALLDERSDPSADDLGRWTAAAYEGEPEPVSWLVPDIIARSETHLVAAMGDTGKGMLLLNLALQLASGLYLTGRRAPFGRSILPSAEPCTVVILSAEDRRAALHRRMSVLDPTGEMRRLAGDRLRCVPMPNAGGLFDLVERDGGTYRPGSRWLRLLDQMAAIPDLGLVAIDPLSPFVSLDIDSDSVVASKVIGEVNRAASLTGAAFIIAHHMRKRQVAQAAPKKTDTSDLPTHASVRSEIRGVASLVDSVRMGYGIVPLPGRYAKPVLQRLNERGDSDEGRIYWGAPVKTNGRIDRRERLYVRADYGLLEDRTAEVAVMGSLNDALRGML